MQRIVRIEKERLKRNSHWGSSPRVYLCVHSLFGACEYVCVYLIAHFHETLIEKISQFIGEILSLFIQFSFACFTFSSTTFNRTFVCPRSSRFLWKNETRLNQSESNIYVRMIFFCFIFCPADLSIHDDNYHVCFVPRLLFIRSIRSGKYLPPIHRQYFRQLLVYCTVNIFIRRLD